MIDTVPQPPWKATCARVTRLLTGTVPTDPGPVTAAASHITLYRIPCTVGNQEAQSMVAIRRKYARGVTAHSASVRVIRNLAYYVTFDHRIYGN